ncbi:MAG TPA: hypothetical protein PKZ76_12085 [Xanthomonadaceae bacterium]|nr:hypothetical protein [Xanthomonadaceae bacterium]
MHRSLPALPSPGSAHRVSGPIIRSTRDRRYQVWSVQQSEGKDPCFATARRFVCDQFDCPWRSECLSLRAEWMR